MKNKLFFFADYEGTFERAGLRSSLYPSRRLTFARGISAGCLGAQILDARATRS